MLFKKKENSKINSQPEETKEKVMAPSVNPAMFSARIGGVFAKIYECILSVDLNANVYRVESGTAKLSDVIFPLSGYYADLIKKLSANEEPENRINPVSTFTKENIISAFKSGKTSVSGIICLREYKETDQNLNITMTEGNLPVFTEEQPEGEKDPGDVPDIMINSVPGVDFHYYQLRAERLPDAPEKQRCLIYVKEVSEKDDNGIIPVTENTEDTQIEGLPENWESESTALAFGGRDTILFAYDIESDVMTFKFSQETTATKNFLSNISSRADWLFYHDDVKVITKAFEKAKSGERVKEKVRLRDDGNKTSPFHIHRMLAEPVYNGRKVVRIMGAFSDIDAETKARNKKLEITKQIDKCVEQIYSSMYEINLTEDKIYKVVNDGSGFNITGSGEGFSAYINRFIKYQLADKSLAEKYLSLLKPGFLEKKTSVGIYEFETSFVPQGLTEAKWFNETFYRLSGTGRFLYICRDINQSWKERDRAYSQKIATSMSEYNAQMLAVMAELVEFRNFETGAHIAHVCELTRIILNDVAKRSPLYDLTPHKIDVYVQAAMMHDVGKITIPDRILNKPGRLTAEEFEIMKTHTVEGYNVLERMKLKGQDELFMACADIALHHHERFDGSGYPHGLVGDAISIGAQAVGMVDAVDAMASTRCYKAAIPLKQVIEGIYKGECGSFNPKLLESLKACEAQIVSIYEPEQ